MNIKLLDRKPARKTIKEPHTEWYDKTEAVDCVMSLQKQLWFNMVWFEDVLESKQYKLGSLKNKLWQGQQF